MFLIELYPVWGATNLYWIDEYRLEDYSTNQLVLEWSSDNEQLVQNAPVLAGAEYRLSFLINVRQTVDNAVLELRLSESILKKSETVFWDVETVDLPLTKDFNPTERITRFRSATTTGPRWVVCWLQGVG